MIDLRQNRKTLFVVTALYVVVGFVLATASAIQGDRLGTFLGFIIISGAIAIAVIMRILLVLAGLIAGIESQTAKLRTRIEDLNARLVDAALGNTAVPASVACGSRIMDLSSIGRGDPSILAATTLDRAAYPRLVRTMESAPPLDAARREEVFDHTPPLRLHAENEPSNDGNGNGAATKNFLRTWKLALREGDLATCREVYSALIDLAEPDALAPLKVQLAALADRVESRLREEFTLSVNNRRYGNALVVGERILCLLPDRPVAEDFRRLRPMLERRISRTHSADPVVEHSAP